MNAATGGGGRQKLKKKKGGGVGGVADPGRSHFPFHALRRRKIRERRWIRFSPPADPAEAGPIKKEAGAFVVLTPASLKKARGEEGKGGEGRGREGGKKSPSL